jgi:hypothetical protein
MTNEKKTLPKPETRSAILATAYHPKGPPVFTPHVYVDTRVCELPLGDGAAYEFIFRCLVHGTERRYGNVEISSQEVN